MEKYGLITMLVGAIVLAFVFGMIAQRLKLSPIVGYLLAGVAVGPHTPGFVGNIDLALQLSEIGVILLMFGVGLKISLDDLWSVRGVALPVGIVHTFAAAAAGYGAGLLLGMTHMEAIVLGASLSIASTIVLMRALEDRKLIKTDKGRIFISWLLIEDIIIVLAIVALPAVIAAMQGGGASPGQLLSALGLTFAKIAVFTALMLIVGARIFPWLIILIAHTKSRELLSLGTLALALGVAYAAYFWFDASFALGAFLGGLVLNGSKFSHKVAEDSLPLRDTFAVLFFVSVGMLFDPGILLREPAAVLAVVAVIVLGKAALAYGLMNLFRQDRRPSVLAAVGLAQIGEFSFVMAGLGRQLGVMSETTYNLVLAGALISIALNPLLFNLADRVAPGAEPPAPAAPAPEEEARTTAVV